MANQLSFELNFQRIAYFLNLVILEEDLTKFHNSQIGLYYSCSSILLYLKKKLRTLVRDILSHLHTMPNY